MPQTCASWVRPYSPTLAKYMDVVFVDSPVTTLFIFACFIVQFLNSVPGINFAVNLFAVPSLDHFNVFSPLSWFKLLFGHAVAHANWAHFNGNVVNLLLVMPACERAFGASNMIQLLFIVTFSSGLTHMFLGPKNTAQLGASGVVFAMILLNSLIEVNKDDGVGGSKRGQIPLTFVCQFLFWINNEIICQLWSEGKHISHLAHLTGAFVGVFAGYNMKRKNDKYNL
eukprot:GSMAST32.ASY1.ANO1.949.1 assembled CDS